MGTRAVYRAYSHAGAQIESLGKVSINSPQSSARRSTIMSKRNAHHVSPPRCPNRHKSLRPSIARLRPLKAGFGLAGSAFLSKTAISVSDHLLLEGVENGRSLPLRAQLSIASPRNSTQHVFADEDGYKLAPPSSVGGQQTLLNLACLPSRLTVPADTCDGSARSNYGKCM